MGEDVTNFEKTRKGKKSAKPFSMGQDVANFQMTEMAKTEEHMSEVMQTESKLQQKSGGIDDVVQDKHTAQSFQRQGGGVAATKTLSAQLRHDPLKWVLLLVIAVLLLQNVGLEVKLGGNRKGSDEIVAREQKPFVLPHIQRGGYTAQIPAGVRIPGGGRGLSLGPSQGKGLAMLAKQGSHYQRGGQSMGAVEKQPRKGRTPTIMIMDEEGYDETDMLFGEQDSFRA
jgi:hypothetical protein